MEKYLLKIEPTKYILGGPSVRLFDSESNTKILSFFTGIVAGFNLFGNQDEESINKFERFIINMTKEERMSIETFGNIILIIIYNDKIVCKNRFGNVLFEIVKEIRK